MIQCYAMHDKENFCSQLNAVVDKIPKGDIEILMPDFNWRVGSGNSNNEHGIGRYGLREMNENGEQFAEFCGYNDMVIEKSLFPFRPVHKVTWVFHDGVENGDAAFLVCGTKVAPTLRPTIIS